jgi:hypothetical protein
MKHLLILLSFIFILVGCKKEDDKPVDNKDKYATDTSEIKTIQLENQNEQFYIKYAFDKGKDYEYRLTNIAENTQTVNANDTLLSQRVKQTLTYLIKLKVLDIDVDNIYELSFTITSVKLEADANGEKYFFESSTSKDSLDRVRYSEYVAVLNNPFNIRVSKIGEIVEIYKADRIVNEFLKLKGAADSVTTAEKDYLKKDMIERALKPIVVQVFRQLPDKMMAKDSLWTNPQEPTKLMVFQVQNTSTYKVKSLELFNNDKIAVIDAGLKTIISGNNKVTDRGATYVFNKPTTYAEGKIYFNLAKGCVQKSKTNSKIQISYSMEVPTPKGNEKGMKSEIVLNTNILELL